MSEQDGAFSSEENEVHPRREVFINEFKLPGEKVLEYKQRRRLHQIAAWVSIISYLILIGLGVLVIIYPILDENLMFNAFTLIVGLSCIGPLFYYMCLDVFLAKSSIDDETVAYHELAMAIEAQDHSKSPKAILSNLQQAQKYLSKAELERMSTFRRNELVDYLNKLCNSMDKEMNIKKSFPTASNEIIEFIDFEESNQMLELTNDIELQSKSEMNLIGQIMMDANRAAVYSGRIFTGYFGVLMLAGTGGYVAFQVFNETIGTFVVMAILTSYGLYLRRGERTD